jgi:membrane protease YdiL (CAAX protease family)
MIVPGLPSLLLLGYCLLVLPMAAARSARVIKASRAPSGALPISRQAIWIQTLISQCVLLALAWSAGSSFGYQFFWLPPLGGRAVAAAATAFLACVALYFVAKRLQSSEERRQLVVFALAPRNATEATLWCATVVAASIAEEAAYRGVLAAVLTYATGSLALAIAVSATAFAVAHATQGLKSGVIIFGIALVMHALVEATGTLVLAMGVHAAFDFFAGYRIAREAATLADGQPAQL